MRAGHRHEFRRLGACAHRIDQRPLGDAAEQPPTLTAIPIVTAAASTPRSSGFAITTEQPAASAGAACCTNPHPLRPTMYGVTPHWSLRPRFKAFVQVKSGIEGGRLEGHDHPTRTASICTRPTSTSSAAVHGQHAALCFELGGRNSISVPRGSCRYARRRMSDNASMPRGQWSSSIAGTWTASCHGR
jgi:hypothetical protein